MEVNLYNAVTERLRQAFGEETSVFEGAAPPGTAGPCFVVRVVSAEGHPVPPRWVRKGFELRVLFLPAQGYADGSLCENAEKALAALETLTVLDCTVFGAARRYEVGDGTASVFGSYQLFLQTGSGVEQMDDIQISAEARG